jgi:pilus assembly protein CpaE
VLDLPRHMLIQYPHMVHDAHVAVVVSELTLAATRDTIRILAWLKSNAPQTKVIVVANRVPSGGALEISRKDFEQSIERRSTSSSRTTASSRPRPPSSASRWPKSPPARWRRRSTQLSNMVLSHASEEGAARRDQGQCRRQVAGRQSEVDAGQAERTRPRKLTIRRARAGGARPPRRNE